MKSLRTVRVDAYGQLRHLPIQDYIVSVVQHWSGLNKSDLLVAYVDRKDSLGHYETDTSIEAYMEKWHYLQSLITMSDKLVWQL